MATLSVLYLTRNDAAVIKKSMDSIAGIADEIIVIDAGSVDDTAKIARQYRNIKLITHGWVHDFSKSRNFGLAHCTSDWIMYVDADEYLDPKSAATVKAAIQRAGSNISAFSLHVIDHPAKWDHADPGCKPFFPSPQVRVFRRNPLIRFEGRVMESVKATATTAGAIDVLDARVHHFIWRGKGEEFAKMKVGYYRKLGAALPDPGGYDEMMDMADRAMPAPRLSAQVAVVVLAYNHLDKTKQCVNSVIRCMDQPIDLILVNNGSTDGTESYMRDTLAGRAPISFPRNEGVARGKNAGAMEALRNPSLKYICFLDNDTIVSPGWIETMTMLLDSDDNLAIVGPVTTSGPDAQSVFGQYPSMAVDAMAQVLPSRNPEIIGADEVGGFCMVIRADVMKKVGMFDESFGLYGFDADDMCRRVRTAGYKISIANRAYVIHRGGWTIKSTPAVNWHSIMLTSAARYKTKWNLDQASWPVQSGGGTPSIASARAKPSSSRVSIVIIAHNRLDMTRKCLESIARTTSNYELIFVDNASTDGTADYVRRHGGIKVITNPTNVGVPKARNQGIRASTAPYIVLMDNDIEVKQGWLEEMIEPLRRGAADVVGIEAWQINSDFCASHKCSHSSDRYDYLSGACTITRRKVFEMAGLLDENFSPAYYEDSLAGDRLVPVRINGVIDVMTLEELFHAGRIRNRNDGREESLLEAVEVLSVDPESPCPPLAEDDLPAWWKNRFLSERERLSYEAAMRGDVGREFIDNTKPRIRKRIRRSLGEEAAGMWKKATNVIRHKTNKAMYRIDSKHGQTVCTGDHSIMCWSENKLVETKPRDIGRLCSVSLPVEHDETTFVELPIDGDPDGSGWVRFPNPRGEDYSLPKLLRYDTPEASAFFKLLGYYASEGSYSNKQCNISVCDEGLAKKIRDAAEAVFKRTMKIYKYANPEEGEIRGRKFRSKSPWYYRVIIGNRKIARLMASLCGVGHASKRVPTMVLNATEARKLDFLDGVLEGDAYRFDIGSSVHESKYSKAYKDMAFRFSSTSLRLASGICLLLSTLGKRYSVSYCDEKRSWMVDFVQFRKNSRTKVKVSSVGRTRGHVYDISVEGTNTFVDAMGMLVVHNTEMSMRAKDHGFKIHWIPSKHVIHHEHSTLIHGQKSFSYQDALTRSQQYFARKRKGQVSVTDELLPPLFRRLKVLYLAMYHDYGVPERGTSFEHDNFYPSLKEWERTSELVHFDFVALGKQHGVPKMSDMLLDEVQRFCPDVLFAVFFDPNHDPRREALQKISRTTPTRTIGWFCDSHWRYDNFDRPWADYLDYNVTTSQSAHQRYLKDGLGCKVIKSQWAAAPNYRKIPGVTRDIGVSFVGQPHGDRRAVIDQLRRAGIHIETYGTGWGKRLTFEEMVSVFNRSKINLNLNNASDARYKQIKGRNFEVPGCGGLLLTELAENLADYYVPDKEIVTYGATGDLPDIIRNYLVHDDLRESIADAAYARTMAEHTYAHRFNHIFTKAGLL